METLFSGLRPLLRLALALAVSFALLIVGVQALGSLGTPPAALDGLHLTECALPCWFGITPGVTAMVDAEQQLGSASLGGVVYRTGDARSISTAYAVGDALVRVDIVADEAGQVVQITIFTAPMKTIRLGDALHALGTPACYGGNRSLALYSGATADAVAVGSAPLGKPGLWTTLNYIDIYVHAYQLHPCTSGRD